MPAGYMCTHGICVRPDATERWWNDYINSPGFEYYNNPLLSDEEIERLGRKYMPNGRPVDQDGFWDASEQARSAYMQAWSPLLDEGRLGSIWAMVNMADLLGGVHGKQAISGRRGRSTSCFGGLGGVSDKCKNQYLRECQDRGSKRCSNWLDGLVNKPPTWAKDFSHNFLKALLFIFYEMVTNLESPEFKRIKRLRDKGDLMGAAGEMVKVFKTGGKWDHKKYLVKLLGIELPGTGGKLLYGGYICVKKSCEQGKGGLMVYYDVFSNIHYGFIMAALGWPLGSTLFAPKLYSLWDGENDYGDDLSARFGFRLYERESRGGPAGDMLFRDLLVDVYMYLFDQFIVNGAKQLKEVR